MARFEEATLEAVAFLAWWMSGHRALVLPPEDAGRCVAGVSPQEWEDYSNQMRQWYRDRARLFLQIIARRIPIYENEDGEWEVVDGAG